MSVLNREPLFIQSFKIKLFNMQMIASDAIKGFWLFNFKNNFSSYIFRIYGIEAKY